MTDVTIIIVSHNTRELLRDCLASIEAACPTLCVQTCVIDNASADGSAEMVAAEFGEVELTTNPNNSGFAAANNLALTTATGRYVVLLNPDTVLSPNALTTMVQFLDDRSAAGYCGPRLVNPDGTHQPSARRFPRVFSSAYTMLGWSTRFPNSRNSLDMHRSNGDRESFRADWMTGACLMVRQDAVAQVGPLDDGYFLYFEETDWCKALSRAGWEGWYVASAEVMHFGGQSVTHESDVRPLFGDHPTHWVRSSRRYMRRHHGWLGMILADATQVLLYALVWLRHVWRRGATHRQKARCAAASIRCLLSVTNASQANGAGALG